MLLLPISKQMGAHIDCIITSNNEKWGQLVGEYIAKRLNGRGYEVFASNGLMALGVSDAMAVNKIRNLVIVGYDATEDKIPSPQHT